MIKRKGLEAIVSYTIISLLLKLPAYTHVEMFGKSTAADMLEFLAKRLRAL